MRSRKSSIQKIPKSRGSSRRKNHCKTAIIIGIIVLIVCVLCASGLAIYHAISDYQLYQATNAEITDFILITKDDYYNTVAISDDHLEVIASDWGAPSINRQIKIDLKTGEAKAIVHYGRTEAKRCDDQTDTNCIPDEVYTGTLSPDIVDQLVTNAKAILADKTKATFNISQYTENETLVELCQTVINNLKED